MRRFDEFEGPQAPATLPGTAAARARAGLGLAPEPSPGVADPIDPAAPGAEARAFVVELARALHVRGIAADRLEAAVGRVSARLGVSTQVFSLPTSVQIAFDEPDGGQRVTMLREEQGDVDLGRIARLNELLDRIVAGALTVPRAREALREIAEAPPSYPALVTPLAFGLASGSACFFFGGGPADLAASALIGTAVGTAAVVTARRPTFRRVFDPVAALVVSLSAAFLGALPLSLASEVVTLSALIVLVPGFTLTVAMSELAVRHLSAGTARLAGAGMSFLSIGLGIGLGRRLAQLVGKPTAALEPHRWSELVGPWLEPAALVVAALSFAVLFQARRRDAGWILVTSAAGYHGAAAGSLLLGPELGVFVGALVVGTLSNGIARLFGRSVWTTQVPGIMLLVPGSIGFRSVTLFLAQDALSGVEAGFRMAMVAVALVGGILFANVLVSPRRDL